MTKPIFSSNESNLAHRSAQLNLLRVIPADFARICGVSRQSVSKWVKNGIVAIDSAGQIDAATAIRQILSRGNSAKLRARIFKNIAASADSGRQKPNAKEEKISSSADRECERCEDITARNLYALCKKLACQFDSLIDAHDENTLEAAIQAAIDEIFYPDDCAPGGQL